MVSTHRITPFATVSVVLCLLALSTVASVAEKPWAQSALVVADLIAEVETIEAGRPFFVAVRLRMQDTWHINWRNPGDAGLAPSVSWTLPEGFHAGVIEWPHPQRYRVGPLILFGYDSEVLLLTEIVPPANVAAGSTVPIAASVDWLACQEACIPGEAEVTLTLPVAASATPNVAWQAAFATARQRLPQQTAAWRIDAWYQDDYYILIDMQSAADAPRLDDVFFFPLDQGIIENGALQELSMMSLASGIDGGYQLKIARSQMVHASPDRLTGVLVSSSGWEGHGGPRALYVDVPLQKL